jgi:hypothetical protein
MIDPISCCSAVLMLHYKHEDPSMPRSLILLAVIAGTAAASSGKLLAQASSPMRASRFSVQLTVGYVTARGPHEYLADHESSSAGDLLVAGRVIPVAGGFLVAAASTSTYLSPRGSDLLCRPDPLGGCMEGWTVPHLAGSSAWKVPPELPHTWQASLECRPPLLQITIEITASEFSPLVLACESTDGNSSMSGRRKNKNASVDRCWPTDALLLRWALTIA